MIILIDNYDSFVFNLARYIRELGHDCMVVRNDQKTITELEKIDPSGFVLSPGPCGPEQSGICLDLVKHFYKSKPILGVCLGHQVIAHAFESKVVKCPYPRHGKASTVTHSQKGLFQDIPNPMTVGRYHSLSVEMFDQSPLRVDAKSDDGEIMAISHHDYPVFGIQFHPESILTQNGHDLLSNFIKTC